MKTTKFITGLFLCGSIFAACDSDDDHGEGTLIDNPTKVTISITNPSNPNTYAPTGVEVGSPAENKVSSIEIYVFNPDGSIDTKTGVTGTNPGNGYFTATDLSTDATLKFTVIMNSGGDKKLVAVANMGLGALDPGEDYDDLKAKLSTGAFKASANEHNSRTIPANGFEMSGEIVADIASAVNSVSIPISRLVSKINAPKFTDTNNVNTAVALTQNQKEELWGTGAVIPDVTFRPIGYALVNGITKSSVLFNGRLADNDDTSPRSKPWGDWTWTDKSYLNSSFTSKGKYTNTYSGPSDSDDWFLAHDGSAEGEDCVYVYENKPKTITVNTQTGFDPLNVYAFVIKGELVVEGDNSKNKVRYWRVDLVRNDAYHILRNNSYYVYIKTIVTIGFETEEEAEKDPDIITDETSAEIQLVVNEWRTNQTETDM
jgi:hypothetical protein